MRNNNNFSKQKLLEIPPMEYVGGNKFLRLCRFLSAQVVMFIVIYQIYNMLTSTYYGNQHPNSSHSINGFQYNNELHLKSQLTLGKLQDFNTYSHDPQMQMWFFEHVFQHPGAELLLLENLERDGATPILSSIRPRERDITLVTQTSSDRLMAVERSARTWGGEMVVAVHVRLRNETSLVYRRLSVLHKRIEALGRCRLNIYFALEDGFESPEKTSQAQYPVNAMRNLALGKVKTDLVFLLDADFVPNPGLHESLTEDEEKYKEIMRRTTEQHQLLVAPAFESVISTSYSSLSQAQNSGMEIWLPTTKSELFRGWKNGSIDCFHCARAPGGHMSTNFQQYFDPTTTIIPYTVRYREFFEPYFIAAKDLIPRFDARFRGYGKNKQSHAYHCAAMGFQWRVLPEAFVYAVPHPHSTAWEAYFGKETSQRMRIQGLYKRFKREVQQSSLTAPLLLQKKKSLLPHGGGIF